MIKQNYSLILLGALLSFLGCSEKNTEELAPGKDITTLTMYSIDINKDENNFSSPVARAITDATGVRLEIEYPQGDIKQKIGIMIASSDYPDLLFVKSEEMAQLEAAGAYLNLRPLIDEYGPNIKRFYGENLNRLRFSTRNPAVYALSTTPVEAEKWIPAMGFELQLRVVKALGYPEIKTLEDYENAIRTYLEMYPTTKGEPNIGITLCVDDWRWLITLGNPAGFVTGLPDDGNWYINPETYEASYRFLRPQEREYFRWLNKLFHEGLIDPDSFVQRYESYMAKIASGRVLGLIDAKWEYAASEAVLRNDRKFDRTYGVFPVQMDETTKAQDFRDVGYIAGYGVGISSSCKNPLTAIRFLDWMCTEESQILRNWGIEGQHYILNEQGRRIVPNSVQDRKNNDSDFAFQTGIGVYNYPFPVWGDGKLDSTGQTITTNTIDNIKQNYHTLEQEVLAAYGVGTWADLYPQADELPKSDWGAAFMVNIPLDTGISENLAVFDEMMRDGIINSIISPPEEFDAIWDQIIEDLKRGGVDEMGRAFTQLVKAQVASFQE